MDGLCNLIVLPTNSPFELATTDPVEILVKLASSFKVMVAVNGGPTVTALTASINYSIN